jgi:hypothetical protein
MHKPSFMNDISFSDSDFYSIFFTVGSIGILVMGLFCIVSEVQSRKRLRKLQTGAPLRKMARRVSPEEFTTLPVNRGFRQQADKNQR